MEIIDLSEKYEQTWLNCLEDWSEEMKNAGDTKKHWFEIYRDRGFRAKLAVEEDRTVGMIQYIPIENSYVEGKDLYFIYCIWVHGHKEGMGNQQKRGIGKALLEAAEADVRNRGGAGMAAWGLAIPIWMKSSWFRKHGYKVAGRNGIAHLLWKPFSGGAEKPAWMKMRKKPENSSNRVVVTAFTNGWCQVQNINLEKARAASLRFPEIVQFRQINTFEGNALAEWGIPDGIFVDNRLISTGPPLSEEKIAKVIASRIRKKRL